MTDLISSDPIYVFMGLSILITFLLYDVYPYLKRRLKKVSE
jgi:hypothetical protein